MSRKRFSLSSRYKRFFMNERTALIAAVMSMLILPVIYSFGIRSGGIDLAGSYDLLMRLLLIVTLFYSLKKHKLFLMQAATVGLLFCMLCAQSQYALGNLASRDSETYITMGLQGFVFLAGERMILFIQSFVCVSHFIIHAARRQEAIRVSVNQVHDSYQSFILIEADIVFVCHSDTRRCNMQIVKHLLPCRFCFTAFIKLCVFLAEFQDTIHI